MKKIRLIVLFFVVSIYTTMVKADIYTDIWALFHIYAPKHMEHHKKEGIQIISFYDCINDSSLYITNKENQLDSDLDDVGIYIISLETESHGLEIILIKEYDNYNVFCNTEPQRPKILREVLRIYKQYPNLFSSMSIVNIVDNIINPLGSWESRQMPSHIDSIGGLKLFFKLDTIKR